MSESADAAASPAPPGGRPWQTRVAVGVLLGAATLLVITLSGYFGRTCRWFDTFSHFRQQYLLAGLIMLTLALCLRRFRKLSTVVLVAALGLNLLEVLPWYFGGPPPQAGSAGTTRICLLNVLRGNSQYAAVRDFVIANDPDLLVLMEIDDQWLAELTPLDGRFAEKLVSTKLGDEGIVVYSTYPIRQHEELVLSPAGRPNLK